MADLYLPEFYCSQANSTIFNGDALRVLARLDSDSIDCIVTDPPYGYSFMGRNWDRAVIGVETWAECLRVLKPGAFAFVMSAPRQDVLSRMIVNLQDAGFETGFTSLYWAYATGFPKAANIGKLVDKRLGAEREIVGEGGQPHGPMGKPGGTQYGDWERQEVNPITAPATPEAQALDGSYAGFQPKPAVEIILVTMKPLSEKTYVDQALANGKGVTWLDDGRIPHRGEKLGGGGQTRDTMVGKEGWDRPWRSDPEKLAAKLERVNEAVAKGESQGRFPGNLLISDGAVDDGVERISTGGQSNNQFRQEHNIYGDGVENKQKVNPGLGDSGSFSRYFSLDAWWTERVKELPEPVQATFRFLIATKAATTEKEKGLLGYVACVECGELNTITHVNKSGQRVKCRRNSHPTVKPVKLMSYLITLGSRQGDVILDPFVGSGTTLVAARLLGRDGIGIDNDAEACEIARLRVAAIQDLLL